MKIFRSAICLFAALSLAPAVQAQEAPHKQPGKWAQDYLHRPVDPAVRFGTLPNGLRYAIMHNEMPKEAISMRMLIRSGSLKERDEERGLAHFLEHMAFRGSANVPDGEVVHMLERHGLRFGPDTNASTSHVGTIYMFNFPDATPDALDTGLKLFREIGERLKLDPALVEAEKGVVLSEERIRDTPAYKATKANIGLLFQGARAPDRLPIGLVETIKAATPERLRRYYLANYRPDNATIIVVGAVDPAAVEAQIKARFSDWKPVGPADPFDPGAVKFTQSAAEFVADGAPDNLALYWVRPRDDRAETEAVGRERMERLLAIIALNNRLSDRALQPGSPFTAASAGASDSVLDTIALANIGLQADPAKWRPALDAVLEEQGVLLRDGISEDDLKRARVSTLARLQSAADGISTRRDEALADGLVGAASGDELFTSPVQDLAFAQDVFAKATPQSVTAALRKLFTGTQPLLFRTARAEPATPPVLQQALAAAQARPLPAAAVQASASWPYGSFGAPGAVVSRKEDAGLGATVVTFANGTRLFAKQTPYQKDRISIAVSFGSGQSGVSAPLTRATWAAGLFPVGGMGKMSVPALQKLMQTEGKLGGISPGFFTRRFRVNGGTRPADFAFEMQLLAAYVTDPGFRPEMGDQLKARAPMLKTQINTQAGAVFQRDVTDLLQGNDRRFAAIPSDAEIDATQPEDIAALVRAQLAGPADVAIVGDLPVDEAIRQTAATFGAIPRAARTADAKPRVTMPAGRAEPYVFRHGGRADQAYYGVMWPLPDFLADQKLSYVADVTAALIQSRLIDTVREKLGLTYSPSANAMASLDIDGLGYLMVAAETPPDKFEAMRGAVLDVIEALRKEPISADQLERARKPLIESSLKARETNDFWVQSLARVLQEPRARDDVIDRPKALGAVTADQVKALLDRYVAGKTPITAIAQAR